MALTYYRYDDASAPTLTGQVGSLVALLDAVLVTGYGSKAAAGWTKPYTGSNKAAFRMATGAGKNGHYLRILDDGTSTDGAARTAHAIGYQSMTTVDAGTKDFPIASQRFNSAGLLITKSDTLDATARPWLIVADDTAFFFYSWHTKTSFDTAGPASRMTTFFFGQCDAFNAADTKLTFINGRNSATYSDTTSYTDGARINGTATFSANNRSFIAGDSFGLLSSITSGLCRAGSIYASHSLCSGLGAEPYIIDGTVGYSPNYVAEREPAGVGYCLIRGTIPILFNAEGTAFTLNSTSVLRLFDVISGTGADAGKDFMVIGLMSSNTLYHCFIQISGAR